MVGKGTEADLLTAKSKEAEISFSVPEKESPLKAFFAMDAAFFMFAT